VFAFRLDKWNNKMIAPPPDAGVSPAMREKIALARKRDLASLEALADEAEFEAGEMAFDEASPSVVRAIGEAFDVELPALPDFESFLPEALRKNGGKA
jgi:hypothetical protein